MHAPDADRPPPPKRRRARRRRTAAVGQSPGTLQPVPESLPPRLSAIGYGAGAVVDRESISPADIPALRKQCPVVWVDVTGLGDTGLLQRLGEEFQLHRLALEDVLNLQQRAKVEDFDTHEFLLLRMVDSANTQDTEQFAIFVGQDFVLTFQERPGDCFGLVRQRLRDPTGTMQKRGSDYLAYALLDAVVDAYFPVLEELGVRLEKVEERILSGDAHAEVVRDLYAERRMLLELRRAVWPLREATSSLVRGEGRHFGAEVQPYLRDVHDHIVQLLDLFESYREMSSSLLDLQLSTVNHRLNEVIKLLTIISTIFIPLTFVVGIYGMNFDHMPELRSRWGYPIVLGSMATIAGAMLLWFRKKRWI